MQSPAGRLLGLLSLLQARPHWNAVELASRLGVTPRTVRRDVTRLRELGYPVLAEPGPLGGYQLGAGGALPPLLLSDDEAVVVAVGLRAAAGGAASGFEDSAVAALAKLEQVLPARLRDRVVALNTTTVLLAHRDQAVVDPEILLLLAQGCRRLERVRFEYRDGAGNVTDRTVEPYRLVNTERRWYFVARDLGRDAWRTFRVDRMRTPALTGHRFTRTSEPDAAAMVADGLAVASHPVQAEILLRVDPAEAATTIPRTVGTIEPAEEGTLLRIGAPDVEWLAHYLAGVPYAFEVRHPPELRTALRALGRRLQRDHGEPQRQQQAARV
jgi:predicted DNA-binding transcriptional regulator YafY